MFWKPRDPRHPLKKVRFRGLPVIYYTPETQLAFGAAGFMVYKFPKSDSLDRTSIFQVYAMYTLKRQFLSSSRWVIITPNEKWYLEGNVNFNKFPQLYFGIGNDLPDGQQELVDYSIFEFNQNLLRKVIPNLYAGIQYRISYMFKVSTIPGGLLESSQTPGYLGHRVSGVGAMVIYDRRDNVVNPTKGAYLEINNVTYAPFLGSQYTFNRLKIDLRKYFMVVPKLRHILALQLKAQFINGVAPYKQLSELGGSNITRGYYTGRQRDNHYLAVQAEYRAKIWRFIGAVAFVGVGRVAHNFKEFDFHKVWPTFGAGVRITIDQKEQVNLRFDYARGTRTQGFYLDAGEVF